MGYSKIQLKCLECGDKIDSIYDSRINVKNNRSVCRCGNLEFTAENLGSFSYNRNAKYEKLDVKYHETLDDYFIVTNKIADKIAIVKKYFLELKDKHANLSFADYDSYCTIENTKVFWYQKFEITYWYPQNIETNQFELDLSFHKINNYKKDEEIEGHIIERLDKFYLFLKMIDNNPEILKDRKYLWDDCELIIDGDKKQLELFDYEFIF